MGAESEVNSTLEFGEEVIEDEYYPPLTEEEEREFSGDIGLPDEEVEEEKEEEEEGKGEEEEEEEVEVLYYYDDDDDYKYDDEDYKQKKGEASKIPNPPSYLLDACDTSNFKPNNEGQKICSQLCKPAAKCCTRSDLSTSCNSYDPICKLYEPCLTVWYDEGYFSIPDDDDENDNDNDESMYIFDDDDDIHANSSKDLDDASNDERS